MIESIPISVIERSEELLRILQDQIKRFGEVGSDIYLADFAAGENDEVPLYFHNLFSNAISNTTDNGTLYIYCTDTHSLRIESLFDKLYSLGLTERTRVTAAKLETMIKKADFPSVQRDYFESKKNRTRIDETILKEHRIPEATFHIGILNNDVIGYLYEYYTEYTDAEKSLQGIREAMHPEGLLMVTQPCMLYPIDNIEVLEAHRFHYITGFDFDLKHDGVSKIDRSAPIDSLSKLGHYTVLLFRCS